MLFIFLSLIESRKESFTIIESLCWKEGLFPWIKTACESALNRFSDFPEGLLLKFHSIYPTTLAHITVVISMYILDFPESLFIRLRFFSVISLF